EAIDRYKARLKKEKQAREEEERRREEREKLEKQVEEKAKVLINEKQAFYLFPIGVNASTKEYEEINYKKLEPNANSLPRPSDNKQLYRLTVLVPHAEGTYTIKFDKPVEGDKSEITIYGNFGDKISIPQTHAKDLGVTVKSVDIWLSPQTTYQIVEVGQKNGAKFELAGDLTITTSATINSPKKPEISTDEGKNDSNNGNEQKQDSGNTGSSDVTTEIEEGSQFFNLQGKKDSKVEFFFQPKVSTLKEIPGAKFFLTIQANEKEGLDESLDDLKEITYDSQDIELNKDVVLVSNDTVTAGYHAAHFVANFKNTPDWNKLHFTVKKISYGVDKESAKEYPLSALDISFSEEKVSIAKS
uniref:hypothetical protein n=1 Tax=Ureaplasma canigenitalium TaxID=42092 RepID=UPI00056DFC1E